jgi:hypothetical protein
MRLSVAFALHDVQALAVDACAAKSNAEASAKVTNLSILFTFRQ